MMRKALSIAVGLTLVIGLLVVSGVAWAQAEETSITVYFQSCEDLAEPEREWVDEDGVRHVRNELYTCTRRRDMIGKDVAWANYDVDTVNGVSFEQGYYAFTGSILGEPATGVGHYTLEGNRIDGVWNYTSDDLMHLEGGGLVKMSAAWQGGQRIVYRGVLLDPPGGEKRQGPRPRR